MPAALTIAKAGAGAGPQEEVKGPTGSHPAAGPSDFCPLQTMEAAIAVHTPFAHAKPSQLTGESCNRVAQAGQASCLRFSPALSSANVVITNNGLTTYATQSVTASAIADNAVIGSTGFSEGVHYWEIICPIFCNSIDFGVTFNPGKITKLNTISEQFLSTTKRTVGVMLDLSLGQISFWLNSRMLKKNKTKELKKPGLTWYPYIRLQEPSIPAILNPFCRLPMADTLTPKFRKKLPQSLTNHNLSHGQISYLRNTKLSRTYLLLNLPKMGPNHLQDFVKTVCPEAKIEKFDALPEIAEIEPKKAAVVKFADEASEKAFVVEASRKDLNLLDNSVIAKILLSTITQINVTLGYDTTTTETVKKFVATNKDNLIKILFPAEGEFEKAITEIGLDQSEQTDKDKVQLIVDDVKGAVESAKNSTQSSSQPISDVYQIGYLKNTDKILVTNGAQAKVFSPEKTQKALSPLAQFSNYPSSQTDQINLAVTKADFKFLLSNLSWAGTNLNVSKQFLEAAKTTFDNDMVKMSYFDAVQGVQTMLATAFTQYQQIETTGFKAEMKDISHSKDVPQPAPSDSKQTISFHDANLLVNILLDLEEQLWSMSHGSQVPQAVRDLWPAQVSRTYSAFTRLSSLAQCHDSDDPISLSELGLLNYEDEHKKIRHFQDYTVPLESIYENKDENEGHNSGLQIALQKQLPANYLLKGLRTWNVSLSQTINRLPPVLHGDMISSTNNVEQSYASIDAIKSLNQSSFVLTGSRASASVNLWTSTLGLSFAGGFNFREQFYNFQKNDKLYFDKFIKTVDQNGVEVLVNSNLAIKGENMLMASALKYGGKDQEASMPLVVEQSPSNAAVTMSELPDAPNSEENEDPFPDFALDGLFDESKCHDLIPVASDSSDSECEDEFYDQFQAAWFKAKDTIEESKEAPKKMTKEDLKTSPLVKPVAKLSKASNAIEIKKLEAEKREKELAKLHQELVLMGFDTKKAQKAINESKANPILNDLIDAIIKDMTAGDPAYPKKEEESKVTYVAYSCSICTFNNSENPGPSCSVCMSPCPESAIKNPVKASDDSGANSMADSSKKSAQDQLAEDLKEAELKEKKIEEQKQFEEEQAKIKEAANILQMQVVAQQAEDALKGYYANSEILEFLFATNNGGKSVKPVVAGAAMFNAEDKMLDLHFVNFQYRKSFMKSVTQSSTNKLDFELALGARQQAIECLYPTLIDQGRYNADNKVLSMRTKMLRASRLGVARIELSSVDQILQIGDDIGFSKPVFFVIIGKDTTEVQARKVIVLSLNHEGALKIVDDQNLTGYVADSDIRNIFVDQADSKVDESCRLILQKANQLKIMKIVSIKSTQVQVELETKEDLSQDEQLVSVSNGLIFIEDKTTGKARSLFARQASQKNLQGSPNEAEQQAKSATQTSNEQQLRVREEEVLKMTIDPKAVSIEQLDKYENLMRGKIAKATSNANYQSASDRSGPAAVLSSIHTWRNDSRQQKDVVGSFEMKFEKPTSLVSLSMDVTFECANTDKLLAGLQSDNGQVKASEEESKEPAQAETEQISSVAPDAQEKKEKAAQALGIFSIKGFSDDAIKAGNEEASNPSQSQKFMPLIVERNKQASYNSSHIASRMLVDNDKMFASNYPKPHITFAHMDGEQMTVQKVTIRVPQNTKTGVYPLGEGLVFLSDTQQSFEIANIFRNFELQHYTAWKEQRMKDPRPLRPFEPVAFFQLDANQTITFDIDFQRAAKYILIMPTAFRKKPVKLSQNPDFVPMEIQFFGVMGHSQRQNALGCVELNDQSQNLSKSPASEYDCEVKILGTDETISVIKNFKIDQLRVMDLSISPETILSLPQPVASQIKFEGLSLIRVTDSNLQLQKISGVSITLRAANQSAADQKPNWIFSNATIQGQEATVAKSIGDQADPSNNENLFDNTSIPTSYYRSCLLSPQFFNVFNKPITRIVHEEQFDLKLRLRVMSFLKHLIKTDHDFCPMILQELDLKSFVEANIVKQSSQTILQASEFLQAFQGEKEFAPTLYEILIEQVTRIPDTYIKANSYDAVIGMLKWAMPLDYQRTLDVLASSLYKSVTLDKVSKAQTPQLVEYRTRISQTTANSKCYPFDDLPFASQSDSVAKSGSSAKESDSNDKDMLQYFNIIQHGEDCKKPTELKTLKKQTFSVKFYEGVQLEIVRIYISQTSGLFDLDVSVEDKKDQSLIYHKVFPPHTVAQFSDHAIYNPTQSLKDYALTISNLNHKCKNLLITLKFSGPLVDKQQTPSAQCIMKFYGKLQDEKMLPLAKSSYMKDFTQGSSNNNKLKSIGSSQMFKVKEGINEDNDIQFFPVCDENADQANEVSKVAETDKSAAVLVEEKKDEQVQIETIATDKDVVNQKDSKSEEMAKLVKDLRTNQEALKQALLECKPGDPQAMTQALGQEIVRCQNALSAYDAQQVSPGPLQAERSTGYLINHASDLTKLIKLIIKSEQVSSPQLRESLLRVHQQAHKTETGDLSDFCLTLFRHYVAFESGQVVENMITFIKQCLIPVMLPHEHENFYNKMISEFLRVPKRMISQKSVIQAMSQLGMPAGDLIGYLEKTMGIKDNEQIGDVAENPISILTSVFVLNMASIKSIPQATIDCEPVPAGAGYTFDQLLKIVFKINIWISSNEKGFFTDTQKVTLLKLAMSNLKLITRNATPQAFLDIMSDSKSVRAFLLELICLNDQELLEIYQQFLIPMLQRLETFHKKLKQGQDPIPANIKKTFVGIIEKSQEILQQTFEVLINSELGQLDAEASKDDGVKKMLVMCKDDKDMFIEWVRMLNSTYLGNVISVNQLKEFFQAKPAESNTEETKSAEKKKQDPSAAQADTDTSKPDEAKDKDGEKETSVQIITTTTADKKEGKAAKSEQIVTTDDIDIQIFSPTQVPIQMVRSLIKLLNKEQTIAAAQIEQSAFEDSESARDKAYSQKQLQKLWSITLTSLMSTKTFKIEDMIEAGVLEELISAFLNSSVDIQQATFVQILTISQTIATSVKNGKPICNLLFMTLKNTDWSQTEHTNVTYLICQGWLEILIFGYYVDLPPTCNIFAEGAVTIACKLDQSDAAELLVHASSFLSESLNIGNFEGVSGARPDIVLKLQIAYSMILILTFAETSSGSPSLKKVFNDCSENVAMRDQLETGMNNLLLWLFLSGRLSGEETYLSLLSNSSLQTNATYIVKRITLRINEILAQIGDSAHKSESIKVALRSLVNIVKTVNKKILSLSQAESIGFDSALKLSKRTNTLLTTLLGKWLVSDSTVNFFCFDLCGFAFLLDTVGSDEPLKQGSTEESKDSAKTADKKITSALAESDLDDLLSDSTGSADFVKSLSKMVKAEQHPDWQVLQILKSLKPSQNDETDSSEVKTEENKNEDESEQPSYSMPIAELGKAMVLHSTSTKDAVSSQQRIDWTANKRVYKHKVYIKQKAGIPYLEYGMLFKLEGPALIREIQIAFINYWQIENEVFLEPLSVLVSAGMDPLNLNHVCTLDIIKDNAYNSVHASVFGKNMLEYKDDVVINASDKSTSIGQKIENAIKRKLESLGNFKAQYINFSMRRNALTCLENSPLSTRFLKPQSIAINYISVTGYMLKSAKGKYSDLVNKSQKKTAMEMMSLVCSGEFSSALKVIANQKETIDKIKEQFDFLANLATNNASISIEPIFIKISSYNREMGDWIIKQLIAKEGTPTNASLTGKLIISDKSIIAQRLELLLNAILQKVDQASKVKVGVSAQANIASFIEFVQIYIRSLRFTASTLRDSANPIDLKVDQDMIIKIISLLVINDQENGHSEILKEFLILLIVPPVPFKNSSIEQVAFASSALLTSDSSEDEKLVSAKQSVACILACQNHQIAMKIFDTKKDELSHFKHSQVKISPEQLTAIAKFWLSASSDPKVCARLQSEGLPVALYNLIREDAPKKEGRILKRIDQDLLHALIQLLLKLSAGHTEIEQELSQTMLEDIQLLAKIRDKEFINKLLLPLIENEVTIPVSFLEQDQNEQSAVEEGQEEWHPDFDSLSCGVEQSQKKEVVDYSKNFLPSTLLDADQKQAIFKGYKDILGTQGKKGKTLMQKTLNGKWTCIHSTTSKMGSPSAFSGIWSTIANQGPVFMLLSGSNQSYQNIVYGGFCQKEFPPVGDIDAEYGVPKTPGDFLFASIKDKGVGFYDHDGSVMLEVISDYEGGGSVSIGQDFFNITNSYDYALVVGAQGLDSIKVAGVPSPDTHVSEILKPQYNFQMERAEIWIADTSNKQGPSVQQNHDLVQKIVKTVGMRAFNQKPHPWTLESNPFRFYRSRPVFMVPSQIKMENLAQIILGSQTKLKAIHDKSKDIAGKSIKEVHEELCSNLETSEKQNNVLDLEFSMEEATSSLTLDAESSQPVDLLDQIQGQYVQNCGFFEAFQKNGGVKKFIYVALVSLEMWTNFQVADSWKQWLKELDMFSEIPQYFQQAIKDKKYKDLLLKILAGQPDQDAKDPKLLTMWMDKQKEAVQLNYKILADTFKNHDEATLREQAISSGLITRILERLSVVSGEKPRVREEEPEDEQLDEIPLEKRGSSKAHEQDVATRAKAKRKGVGYSTKQGERFDVNAYINNKKLRNDEIKVLIDIVSGFFGSKTWKAPVELLDEILKSSLLPILEQALRNSSFLELSKEAEVYHSYLELLRAISKQENLLPTLVKIDKRYKPEQIDSIHVLLGKLNELGSIFLSLNTFKQQTDAKPKASSHGKDDTKQQVKSILLNALSSLQSETMPSLKEQTTSSSFPMSQALSQFKNITGTDYFAEQNKKGDESEWFQYLPEQLQQKFQHFKNPFVDKEESDKGTTFAQQSKPFYPSMSYNSLPNFKELKQPAPAVLHKQAPVLGVIDFGFKPSQNDNSQESNLISESIVDHQLTMSLQNALSLEEEEKQTPANIFPSSSVISQVKSTLFQAASKNVTPSAMEFKEPDEVFPHFKPSLKTPKAKDQKQQQIEDLLVPNKFGMATDSSFADQVLTQIKTEETKEESKTKKIDIGENSSGFETQEEVTVSESEEEEIKTQIPYFKKTKLPPPSKNKGKKPKKSKKLEIAKAHSNSSMDKGKKEWFTDSVSCSSDEDQENAKSDESFSHSWKTPSSESSIAQPGKEVPAWKKLKDVNQSIEMMKLHHAEDSLEKKVAKINYLGQHYDEASDASPYSQETPSDSYEQAHYSGQSPSDDDHSQPSYDSSYQDYDSEENMPQVRLPASDNLEPDMQLSSKVSEQLAKDVKDTYEFMTEALEDLLASRNDEDLIADALKLPLPQAYKALLEPLRFDYMEMKREGTQTYNHKYKDLAQQNQTMPATKMVRLAQELADLSRAVPCENTNATFIRVDKDRVDMMKVLICGAQGTPYAHGCFEFDLFCDNNYPNGPPKMNLTTTGNGAIRFNPNLYACGKVCLSLLGTWQGKSTENWDAKISTILQVLMSTQAIIMSEEVYFNEPGFEQEAGTPDGERRNEGYSNIVRYGNVKYAMLGQLKNPAKGFESIIKRHFYLKKEDVLKTCHRWIERAGSQDANYTHLVNDHNHSIAKDFQKSKTRYKEALTALVEELETVLNALEKPTNYSIKPKDEKKKASKKIKEQAITEGMATLNDVDMDTDSDNEESKKTKMIDTSGKQKEIDIDDEAVKDRWSRYIGAMGVEAVAKQAAANIFVSGAGALGIEISKNLVLSGCKSFTLHDTKPITNRDLSGQFFLNEVVSGKTRAEECMPRLSQLNYYVRCKVAPNAPIPHDHAALEQEPWNFQHLDVIVLTEADYATAVAVNDYCRAKGKKFIFTQLAGVFGRVFNDFGDNFEVLDKNGEELQDTIIRSISSEEKGVVELLGNQKHKFEDGDEVTFIDIEGMKLKEGMTHDDPAVKSDGINETIHKVIVVNPYTIKIGDTTKFTPYIGNGIAKQLRTKSVFKFKSFSETALQGCEQLKYDESMQFADFEKMGNGMLSHVAFEALDQFQKTKPEGPRPWNLEDANKILELAKPIADRYELKSAEWKADSTEIKYIMLFAFQAQGVFNPLSAFFGGYVAQEVVKAITGKFSPTNQFFYYDSMEVLPDFDPTKHIENEEHKAYFEEVYVPTIAQTKETGHRSDGLRICIGASLVDQLAYTNLFMVGAGAIGCELLKNYAMLGVGSGKAVADDAGKEVKKAGSIVLTDPDIIEVSNLNRQFLFRERHLRKPKAQTAAAAAIYMNKDLKGNIIARLDKVCEATAHIFTDKFFETSTVVTNALDNVQARRYIDVRCVSAKTPLLESGTLGAKGHVQVILPYKTESYGSQNDPEDNNEIPHCTLKMFPEETLHCVEWARDKFGKMFVQMPTSAAKIIDQGTGIQAVTTQDIVSLKEGMKLLKKQPSNFMDCVEYARLRFQKLFNNDIKQLLHVYPLDAVTKDGNPFWTLPKKPPTPIEFDKNSDLHCTFITSMACLRANMFFVEIPSKTPRTEQFKKDCGEIASAVSVPVFVANEDKAKAIQQSVDKESTKKDAAGEEEEKKDEQEEEKKEDLDEIDQLKQEFLTIYGKLSTTHKSIGDQDWIEKNLVKSDEFEKDNDANFHIDFMYSLGNCRASCYKLEPMDWITVKLKAGRIVPALATTTASISGLQTLELVKILKGCKVTDHRNIFLNLAVPYMQAAEPGEAIKTKLIEGVEVSLWDRWEVKNASTMTLHNLIAHLEQTYEGLEVRDVLKGGTPIYFHAIMSAPQKAQEKKKVMETQLKKLCDCEAEETYVDLAITCVRKNAPEGDQAAIIAGTPPVRVYF